MFRRLLAERGFDEPTLLQHVSNSEYAYELPSAIRGASACPSCAWCSGLAIDKLPLESAVRVTIGQHDSARAFDYASLDERCHVENGLVRTRKLCATSASTP